MLDQGRVPKHWRAQRGIGAGRCSFMGVRSHSGWTKHRRGLAVIGLLHLSTWCAAAANSEAGSKPERPTSSAANSETGSKPERPTSSAARDSGSGSYSVSKHCPSREQFVKEVLARSPAAARSSARSIVDRSVISIVVGDGAVRGTLRLPTGEEREVVGTTCTEVAGALALVVALHARSAESTVADTERPATPPQGAGAASQTSAALSAQASTTNGDSAQASTTNGDSAQASTTNRGSTSATSATAAASAATVGKRVPPMQAQPPVPRRPPSRAESSSIRLSIKAFRLSTPASATSRWTFGAGATAAFGPAPVGLFGAGLFAEYQSRSSIPHSVLLGAEAAPYATASVQAAVAHYRWGASHASGCVQALRFEASSALWLCAEVVGGVAIVTGQARGPITHSRTASEAWLSAGPAARVRFQISEAYSLDLAAGAGIPVIRHRTVFDEPKLVLHETGNLAGFLAIELGHHSGG